jgi:hypothetical protein
MLCEAEDAMTIVIIDALYILSKHASTLRAAISPGNSNFSAITNADDKMRDQDEILPRRSFLQRGRASLLAACDYDPN